MLARLLFSLAFALGSLGWSAAQDSTYKPKVHEITGNQRVPEFEDIQAWINSKPLKFSDLKGRVVVVHIFAYA